MTIAITIFIALLIICLDYRAYRRIKKSTVNKIIRYTFISVVYLSHLLILLTPVMMYFLIDEDNSCYMMKISMISLTTYLTLSIPRLLFYIFWLPTKNKYWLLISASLSSVVFIFFLYSIFVTRTDYQINDIKINYKNLPAAFNGYRLAFISDIHTGSMLNPKDEVDDILKIINNADVDAVMLGGDIVNIHHSEISDSLLDVYSRLKARDGVFMVLGNHDTGAYVKNSDKAKRDTNKDILTSKMKSIGWVVLRDSTVYIHRDKDSIAISGIDYNEELLKYKHSMDAVNGVDLSCIYNNVQDFVFNITLSHLPQLWNSLNESGYSDLTLSGHVHAMQLKLGSFSPAQFMYKEWSGLYENEKGKLYINDGIGCVGYLARFGARPEITIIELCKID